MSNILRVGAIAGLCLTLFAGAAYCAEPSVRIGLIDMYSGVFAFQTGQIRTGFEIALDEANSLGGVKGQKFELQVADMGTSVEKAITEGRRMILNDKLHYVVVGSHAGAALALGQLIKGRDDVFVLGGIATSKHFTAEVGGPMIGRSNLSTVEMGRILAEHLKTMPDIKTIATIVPDFEYGHDFADDNVAAIKAARPDITVTRQEWPKLGTADFTPNVTALQSNPPDLVVSGLISGDIISFLKAAKGFGLFEGKTRFFNSALDLAKLSAYKDGMPDGSLATVWYPFYALNSPENTKFVDEVKKRTQSYPVGATLVGYVAGRMITEAIRKGGNPERANAASQAMDGLPFASPVGPVKVRGCDNVASYNYFLGTVKRSTDFPDGIGLADVRAYNPSTLQRSCDEILKLREH
jgi:branched-chain amino acid transport system substrate-binding protein